MMDAGGMWISWNMKDQKGCKLPKNGSGDGIAGFDGRRQCRLAMKTVKSIARRHMTMVQGGN